VQIQGSESGLGKSDSQKYSCLQGRFLTVTVGLDLTKPNEALPSQRNKSTAGRQISIVVDYNWAANSYKRENCIFIGKFFLLKILTNLILSAIFAG
jgi:hypothetical protein